MRSLANACRIARLREPWSTRALAATYALPPPISVAELIDHVMGYSSFDKIKRFFVLVLENRSFDHMLGFSQITGIDAKNGEKTEIKGLSDIHAVSDGLEAKECNKDSSGQCWHAAAPTELALQIDPGHEFGDMKAQLGPDALGNTNAGFVLQNEYYINEKKQSDPDDPQAKAPPGVVMRSFLPEQIPTLNYLAREYAVCDQWFSSGPLPTWPNRMFIHAASSGGMDRSPSTTEIFSHLVAGYEFEHGTIFDRLDDAGIDWQIYGDEFPVSWAFANVNVGDITDMEDFWSELFDEDFSYRYVFIEPKYNIAPAWWHHYAGGDSEHPIGNIILGEMLIAKIYAFLSHSPYWEESAFVILYDEGGGFYDHEPPPTADPPGDNWYEGRNENGFDFTKLGPRVPAVVVSPWIPRGTIDHTKYDHTSLLKTVERRFGLDPLTDRDAKADDFAHLFRLPAPRDGHRPASGMTVSEGENARGGEASLPLTLARGDLDETLRLIDAAVASEKRSATALPAVPSSTRIAELPRSTIGFLEVAFIKESKLRPAAQRPAVAERVRQVTTVGQARELLDRLKVERGAVRPDARDMAPGVRIPRRRDRPKVRPPTTPRRTPH
jgi:phospholipase C